MTSNRPYRLDFRSIVKLRCPACGVGRIFAGPLRMNEFCPRCGLRFERESAGYFTGAMYFSYGLAIPILSILTILALTIVPNLSPGWLFLFVLVVFLPFVPMIFRYSRTLFIHLDRALDPDN